MELKEDPGPIDNYVLYDQDNHVSSAVWDGHERGVLRCHEHTSMLDQWKLTPKQITLVEKAGFGYLRLLPAMSLDNALIAALVERWRRETNTFHLTVGELTITLEDVSLLLGLAIDGEPVIGPISAPSSVCEKLLGRVPEDLNGGMVKLTWLKEFFSECAEDAPPEETERCTRAYLLYLVGSTIFSTTTGNKVPVMYLSLFEDFDKAGKFAWGAGALAFLYRALGNASLKSQSTISGCLTLVQCWSYSRLNVGLPKFNQEPDTNCFPFVLKWKGKSGCRTKCNVVSYRKALDSLNPCDVQWLPYKDLDSTAIPEDTKASLILRASRTMLLCFDKAERHLPDRCLRQFGLHQTIPKDVERWERKSRIVDHGVDLMGKMDLAIKEWSERWVHIVDDGGDITDEGVYMQWYHKITRKYIGRVTSSLESEYQRTVTAMREIASIADIVSAEGLDSYNRELLDEVKNIVHKCLTEQYEEMPNDKVKKKGNRKRRQKDHLSMEYE
ncbi:protein MAIN-LIKE 2-like [Vigna unguiculata]|uniref:protein MAIN-LIKE 2-like n=1 Tax=Vigna unguiculata TaxID=3917 RepID=UPI001016C21D|nr:protein MAIN-LIKE 2-like [Vigna unguiculata]XP_027908581.1 protein MAIN-LIKE 2-like [Vigna unguiculata]